MNLDIRPASRRLRLKNDANFSLYMADTPSHSPAWPNDSKRIWDA
jgi:hypothetical protein